MKAYLSLACVAVLLASQAISSSAQDCGIYAETLKHPTDCSKYYELRQFTCPDGLLFNDVTKQCVLPENTTCGQTTTTEEPTTVTTGEPTTVTPEVTSWDTTVEETTTRLPTTTTTETEPPTEGTDDPNMTTPLPTEGTTPEWTTPSGTTPTPEGPQYNCPATDDPNNRVRYSHESNCKYYYLCVQGHATLYSCTTNNHFSPTKKVCKPMIEAGCDRCPDVEVPGEVVRLPHESVCHYYYRCENHLPKTYQCPLFGDYFSRADRVCMLAKDAWCTLPGTTTATTPATTTTTAASTTMWGTSSMNRE